MDVTRSQHRVQTILADVVRRRATGESVPDDVVLAEHPDLADQLRVGLNQLRLIHAAGEKAHELGAANTITYSPQETPRTKGGGLPILCPHCHERIETSADTPITEITCDSCGKCFSLVGTKEEMRDAVALASLSHFDLIERIGMGGFGTVWKARDRKLDRIVAIKVPRQGSLGPTDVEIFLREARAAAQLNHPHIVSVHEIGREGDLVFIVSDYVRGMTLEEWLSRQKPTLRQAVSQCIFVAEALHHAHEHGVVHRDLKPGNIIIAMDGRPRVMDFGMARREVGEVTMTLEGQLLGTPAYMSPEQASGKGHEADRRSDVYSLGVILFELLTCERPFRGQYVQLLHQVVHDDPPMPRTLNRSIPRDLETVVLKCLDKEPSRRYPTVQELADELRRYLRGEAIQARPVGRLERGWRWTRREPLIAGLIALVVLLSVVSSIAVAAFVLKQLEIRNALNRESELRTQADAAAASDQKLRQALQAERQRNLAKSKAGSDALAANQPARGVMHTVKVPKATPSVDTHPVGVSPRDSQTHRSLEKEMYFGDIANAETCTVVGELDEAKRLLKANINEARWEWRLLYDRCNVARPMANLNKLTGNYTSNGIGPDLCEWDPQGDICAIYGNGVHDVHLFDPSAMTIRTIENKKWRPTKFKWNSDGTMLGIVWDDELRVYSREGREMFQKSQHRPVLAWNPTNHDLLSSSHTSARSTAALTIASPSKDGFTDSGRIRLDSRRFLFDAEWRNDGQRVAVLCNENGLALRVVEPNGKREWQSEVLSTRELSSATGAYKCLFSPSGRWIAVVAEDSRRVSVFDSETGNNQCGFLGDKIALHSACWGPGEDTFITAGRSGYVSCWNVRDGNLVKKILVSRSSIDGIAWSSARQRLLAIDSSGDVFLWGEEALHAQRFKYDLGDFSCDPQLMWSTDSRSIGVAHAGYCDWDTVTARRIKSVHAPKKLQFVGPGGNRSVRMTSPHYSSSLHLVDTKTQKDVGLLDKKGEGSQSRQVIRWSADGQYVAVSTGDRPEVQICDAGTANAVCVVNGPANQSVRAVDFTDDGNRFAAAFARGLKLIDVPSGRILFEDTDVSAWNVSWSPGGHFLAIGGVGQITILDEHGQVAGLIKRAGFNSGSPAVSPDGKLVAVLSETVGMPQLYDVATGRKVMNFDGIEGRALSWSPDGNSLAVACNDGYVEVLSAPPGPDGVESSEPNHSKSDVWIPFYEDRLKLAALRAKLEFDDPDTLKAMEDLASRCSAIGRHADAVKLGEEALVARKSKYGVESIDTLRSMRNLAASHVVLGHYSDATSLLQEEASVLQARLAGDDGADAADFRNELALVFCGMARVHAALGEIEAVQQSYLEAVTVSSALVAESPSVAGYRTTLARCHEDLARSLNPIARNGNAIDHQSSAIKEFSRIGTKWRVKYFDWRDKAVKSSIPDWPRVVAAQPLVAEDLSELEFTSALASIQPGVPADYFALSAEATAFMPEGEYRVCATSDDGIRVYIDDRRVIDNWEAHAPVTDITEVTVDEGKHSIRLEYFEAMYGASLRFGIYYLGPTVSSENR